MKTSRQLLMILASAAFLSMAAVEANAASRGNASSSEAQTKSEDKPQEKVSAVEQKNSDTDTSPSEPQTESEDEAAGDKPKEKKTAPVGVVNWLLLSFDAAVVLLAVVMLVFIIKLRKGQKEITQRTNQQAAKSGNIEKIFGDKLKSAIAEAVREKNPILRDYEKLREQTDTAQQALESCRRDLSESRSAYEKSSSEVARLTSELATVGGERDVLQKDLDVCNKDLEAAREESESRRKMIDKYKYLIGQKVLDIDFESDDNDHRLRIVQLGLAKMNAMRDAGVDARNILREFQSFDIQLGTIIRDQEELQTVREGIRQFVEDLFNNEYRISWPKIGANIADYSRNDELDLGESASGTTIKVVKCATIRFASTDSTPFQKAKVICD